MINFLSEIRALTAARLMVFTGLLVCMTALAPTAQAQQLSSSQGQATQIDFLQTAGDLSMRDMYNRSLYLFIRSNPTVLDDQEFYVNFLIFLMNRSEKFNCNKAFSNEFERRDFFTKSFALKDQLRQIINSARIPQRFDIAFTIDTGRYDFMTTDLPFDRVSAVGLREGLSRSISSSYSRNCASSILNGTNVDSKKFAWDFQVVDENGERWTPGFPFGGSLKLSDADARVLFERFGRQLYAVVSYQFLAANNGKQLIQIVPTDGQLFGLSSDAVVRVKSFAHPALSQPSYLDVTNPLSIDIPGLDVSLDVSFVQDGFRAVGKGTRQTAGTGITSGAKTPVRGSLAVGNSVFIMRFAMPEVFKAGSHSGSGAAGGEVFMTLFGAIDFERISEKQAPVSGLVQVLEQRQGAQKLNVRDSFHFNGAFRPAHEAEKEAAARSEPKEPETQLD
ncbi:hypothetical protein RA2_00560 [Roseovarius sp. A-2]|uniref:hypothetical protein n=1 Tax=Roseovarius sp. A-2 TaxID=1570360 RepID=UPI0009B5340D|nr:hypothetical protein [Roseovarius sp. A-2]GAW33522.1 hypothetical protein RA2_00560 [Roseovarius sp. A-2]